MNISFVLPDILKSISGGNVYNKNLILALKELGHNIIIYKLALKDNNEILKLTNQLYYNPQSSFLIIDSLAFRYLHPYLFKLSQKFKLIPLIHMPLGLIDSQQNNFQNLNRESMDIFRACRHIFVTSNYTKEYYRKIGIPEDSISVFKPSPSVNFRKKEYSAKPAKLLNVGNVIPGKNQLMLINTLIRLEKYPWVLKIAGSTELDPDYYKFIRSFVQNKNLQKRVELIGALNEKDLKMLYSESDVLISTSNFETFGMNMYDAVCGGLPVVTTNVGGVKDAVPEYAGIFIPPGDEMVLEEKLKVLFSDEKIYHSMVIKLKQNPVMPDSWKMTAHQLEKKLNRF